MLGYKLTLSYEQKRLILLQDFADRPVGRHGFCTSGELGAFGIVGWVGYEFDIVQQNNVGDWVDGHPYLRAQIFNSFLSKILMNHPYVITNELVTIPPKLKSRYLAEFFFT